MPHRLSLFLLISCLAGPVLAAPKTDIVTLDNGDRITCEVKTLDRGKLTVKTDDMGTLSIKWHRVARIRSDDSFQVTTRDGRLLFGRLPDPGENDRLRVVFEERDTVLDMGEVVLIKAIKYRFIDKVIFSVDFGVSSYKASGISQYTADARFEYGGRIHRFNVRYSGLHSQDRYEEVTRRHDVDLLYDRIITGKLAAYLNGAAQQNEELGVKGRLIGGIGLGMRLIQDNTYRLDVAMGLSRTREWSATGGLVENHTEAVLRGGISIYIYDSPKTTLDVTGSVMPAIDGQDRLRAQVDADIRQEIFKNFFLGLKYFERYDNNPPQGAQSTSDRGVSFAVGWYKK